jgi:hypothetical protein
MADVPETAREESKPLTDWDKMRASLALIADNPELHKFFIKVVTVLVAALIFLLMATWYVTSIIDDRMENSFLKGGPQFWADMENKLRAFADTPDIPPAKKAAIVKQIEKVARKYRPFVDALSASDSKS